MSPRKSAGRRPASLVDASRESTVEDGPAGALFRARALQQLDVAAEIDNQLPLVPRRTWLIVLGIALLALAGIGWAALTPSQTSVTGSGRVVAAGGISQISSMVGGTVASGAPSTGQIVTAGDTVFTIMTMSGDIPVTTMDSGTVWQVLAETGSGVESGTVLATVLPEGSTNSVLLAIPEGTSDGVIPGQKVIIGTQPEGTVSAVSAPLPSAEVSPRIGLPLDADTLYNLVTVSLDAPLTPGSEVQGRIVLTEESVLMRLLGIG